MQKLQEKFNTLDELKKYVSDNLSPDDEIAILLSKGVYYLEDTPAFVRSWETLVYEGEVSSMEKIMNKNS